MTEIWIKTGNTLKRPDVVIEISNMGRLKHYDGHISISLYRQAIKFNGIKKYVYRIIAETFIPKTEEDIRLHRDVIDHISHNPSNMCLNDVRNLRWCTQAENNGFDEIRDKFSKAKLGKKPSDLTRKRMSIAQYKRRGQKKS